MIATAEGFVVPVAMLKVARRVGRAALGTLLMGVWVLLPLMPLAVALLSWLRNDL